jgi:hypothetical protein
MAKSVPADRVIDLMLNIMDHETVAVEADEVTVELHQDYEAAAREEDGPEEEGSEPDDEDQLTDEPEPVGTIGSAGGAFTPAPKASAEGEHRPHLW